MAAEKLSQSSKRKTSSQEEHQPKRPRKSNGDSIIAAENDEVVAGKIKRIFMKNFMCHDAMEVNFNPRVNFIVGANGSGKSAILTALTVGFGAKARATNRGPSIKEFIKKGRSSCMIEITVTNDGPMAYKHETYGNSITLVRNISLSASTYKIKNWRGDIISTKKDELQNIIHQLNIQVDNPISVLNQDVSRSFLVTSGPAEKYKLFMKATRLDEIGDNYKKASTDCDVNKQHLDETKKYMQVNEKEIQQLRKRLKAIESLDETREEYQLLQKELEWALVIEEESKLLDIDVKIKEQEQNVEKLENLESTKAIKEQEIDVEIDKLKQEITQHESEASDSTEKLNEAKKKITEAKKVYEEKREKVRNLHQNIRRKESDILTLQETIKKLERENSDANQKQTASRELQEWEQNLVEVEATLRTKQTDLLHLEENKLRINQEHHNSLIDVEQKNNALTKLRHKLIAFRNQSNDALTVYGSNMPRLLKRIEEAYQKGKFRQKPVGPLGSFIKLKDQQWIPAVENHLGAGTLTSFCVDNSQDGRILNSIMNEIFTNERPPQVVISKFFDRTHDVRDGCTNSPRYPNLLDAMEISHPVIANSLIDQREIECILLIPTSDEACDVMSDVRKVPTNCKRAITKNADLFFPDPNYRTYGGSVTKPRYLQVSTSEAIQSLQEEIDVAEDELRVAEQAFRDIKERKNRNAMEVREVQSQVQNLLDKQKNIKNKIEECKEIIERCNDDNVNAYKAEIEELQTIVEQKKKEEGHMIEEINEFKKTLNALNEEFKNQRDLAQNLDARIQPIKDKIKELKDEKNRLNLSNQGATRRMKEAKQILQKLNSEHQQQQRVVNSKIDIATKVCPRIDTTKPASEIKERLKELKVTIESMERQHGSKEEICDELERKENKFGKTREFAVELQLSNDKQIDRLRRRRTLYHEMKKKLTQRIQDSFENILALRNYRGKITIDHHKKELALEVAPKNDAKRPTNDAKALSGGERSYSTVAFILALWDSTGLPFYFLDEFDVFMDKINRRTIMDILLEHAKSHPASQFAFLTPLDTSHIIADNLITIHRLAPPERST